MGHLNPLSDDNALRMAIAQTDEDNLAFVVVNGMSNNRGTRWDLSTTASLLGYSPEDDAYAEEI